MDQALQPLDVAAHVKAMTHAQTISCEKGAAIKTLCNTLSISLAAHKGVSLIIHQCANYRLFASQECREALYRGLSYAACYVFAPATNLSRSGN